MNSSDVLKRAKEIHRETGNWDAARRQALQEYERWASRQGLNGDARELGRPTGNEWTAVAPSDPWR
jgi:hypothetical protein